LVGEAEVGGAGLARARRAQLGAQSSCDELLRLSTPPRAELANSMSKGGAASAASITKTETSS